MPNYSQWKSVFPFNPFSAYDFAASQKHDAKYGLAAIFLEPPERFTQMANFPPFDIRHVSARELAAYWITLAQRIRKEGSWVLAKLLDALRDDASRKMLEVVLASPASAQEFRQRIKPARDRLMRDEAARLAVIRIGALALFRGGDVLAGLTDEERAEARERREMLYEQEKSPDGRYQEFTPTFQVPAGASRVELGAVLLLFDRQENGVLWAEGKVGPHSPKPSRFAEPFLDYALSEAQQTYLEVDAVKLNLVQRQRCLMHELATRLDALTAYFIYLFEEDTNPSCLLSRLNSFWSDDVFADHWQALEYQKAIVGEEVDMPPVPPKAANEGHHEFHAGDTPLPAEHCYAALVAMHRAPPANVDLAHISRYWPRPLAVRYLNGLPTAAAVASLLALPNRFETARVAQLLRALALDEATDTATSELLEELAKVNFSRAATLRRDMEWEARDEAFFPIELLCQRTNCKTREELVYLGDELPLHLATLADECWDRLLPMPNLYRLPAPGVAPDSWPPLPEPLPLPLQPEAIPDDANSQLRAGIEWLHLWRMDAELAERIWHAVPQAQAQRWIEAVKSATDPTGTAPLPRDIALLEHLMEGRDGFLSQIEVDALLKGVTDPVEDKLWQHYPEEVRLKFQEAVKAWVEKTGRGYLCR